MPPPPTTPAKSSVANRNPICDWLGACRAPPAACFVWKSSSRLPRSVSLSGSGAAKNRLPNSEKPHKPAFGVIEGGRTIWAGLLGVKKDRQPQTFDFAGENHGRALCRAGFSKPHQGLARISANGCHSSESRNPTFPAAGPKKV